MLIISLSAEILFSLNFNYSVLDFYKITNIQRLYISDEFDWYKNKFTTIFF